MRIRNQLCLETDDGSFRIRVNSSGNVSITYVHSQGEGPGVHLGDNLEEVIRGLQYAKHIADRTIPYEDDGEDGSDD